MASRSIILLVVGCLLPSPAMSDYQAGLDAYKAGDFDRAFREWREVASNGAGVVPPDVLAETCYALGMLFWVGQGVRQDTSESALWLRQAAELNHAGAQAKLGYLYQAGQGVEQSDFEALKWFTMAARQGDADAQYNLGVLYRDGLGVQPNADKALQWFREAAANGDPVSARIVADMDREPRAAPFDVNERSDSTATVDSADAVTPVPGFAIGDEHWLRARNPAHYTIQVIALLDAQKLHTFTERHPEWAPFAIYEARWRGQPLWVLVQGDYPDVSQAREAVRGFPADIQGRDELWIRKFVMIQELLR